MEYADGLMLPLVLSGTELLNIVLGAEAFDWSHDDPESGEDVEIIADFFQDLQDWAEVGDDIGAGDRVRASFDFQERIARLMGMGYVVAGGRAPRPYPVRGGAVTLNVAHVAVRRRDVIEAEALIANGFKSVKGSAEARLATDPLRDYFVWWDAISAPTLLAFRQRLNSASREEDMQVFLAENPIFLVQHLSGGHGRWVIPKQKLGAEFVTDFVAGARDSIGFHWWAIELESPKAKPFTKKGDPSQHLSHAIRQITDWREWLTTNQNYASRPRTEHGLGLTEITNRVDAVIIIGREDDFRAGTNAFRRQQQYDANIHIHSFDWLFTVANARMDELMASIARASDLGPR